VTLRWPLALACALAGGLALPLSLAPFDLLPLGLLAPALLLAALYGQGRSAAFLLGWASGIARYGLGVSWVYVSIHEHGQASPLLAGTLVAIFVVLLALLPALAALAFAALRVRTPAVAVLAFTGIWVLLEWTWTWFLTGFPWLFAGYAHEIGPLAGLAPVGGVLLVSLVAVLTGAALWAAVVTRLRTPAGRQLLGATAVLWLAGAALGTLDWGRPAGAPLSVALVQGAIPQQLKWLPESRDQVTDRYLGLSSVHWGASLVIWPEAALTQFAPEATSLLRRLGNQAASHGTTLVMGIPDYVPRPSEPRAWDFLNTAIALGDGEGRYVKQRLVPFGEYVPLENLLRGLIGFFDLPMSHARAGEPDQAPLTADGHRLAVAICYEIVYPDLVRSLAAEADVLVTLSNDTWFGDSLGPSQHMQMARFRARELARPLLRATNDGITAIVDHRGRETARLARFVPGVLTGTAQARTGDTPFAVTGSAPTVALALALLVPSLLALWRRRRA
jgi:apolipoprotein N-acyltransferase